MKLLSESPGARMSMAVNAELRRQVRELAAAVPITHVLETGTFRGLGSTTMLAEAFAGQPPPAFFVTVEANWVSWRQARRNLARFPFVRPLWGRTIPAVRALDFIRRDEMLRDHARYPDVFIDDVSDPVAFYTREVRGGLGGVARNPRYLARWMLDRCTAYAGHNLLEENLLACRDHRPLVLLDSAGGIGYLEFLVTREIMGNRPYWLLLDDIQHIKHYRSYQIVKSDPAFRVLAASENDGWVLVAHAGGNPNRSMA